MVVFIVGVISIVGVVIYIVGVVIYIAGVVIYIVGVVIYVVGVGIYIVGMVIFIVGVVTFIVMVRRKRATRGRYSPSRHEILGPNLQMSGMLKPPPEERLI